MTHDFLCNCEGKHGFIQSGRFSGEYGSGRDVVSICMDCGKIHVNGERNGENFHVSFRIINADQLEAVGKFARLLDASENNRHLGDLP